MQKLLIGLLAVSTLTLGILCATQRKQLQLRSEQVLSVEKARAAEQQDLQTQAARVKELERINADLDRKVQQFTTVTASLRTNEAAQARNAAALAQRVQALKSSSSSGNTNTSPLGKGMGEMLGQMMKDPAMRQMMREQQKAAINMMYGSLFKEMNITPEERDKLRELLTDLQMRSVESAQSLMGDKQASADTVKELREARKQTEDQIKVLLGDERFAHYEDYQKNIGERMQIDQLRTRLAAENLGLQDQQAAQLMQAMKEEKLALPPAIPTDQTQMPDRSTFTAENMDRQLAWIEDYNARVLERARQILSPEQLKQYTSFQEQQASMQKLGLNMAKQMFGGDKAPAPAK